MKRLSSLVVFLFLVVNLIVLTDAEAGYFTTKLGLVQPDEYNEKNYGDTKWEFDDGTNFSIAFGGNIEMFRLEGEISYRKMDFEGVTSIPTGETENFGGDQRQIQFMFNCIWQIMPEWPVSPFLGLGIGETFIYWNDVNTTVDDADYVFTYQAILGASIRVSDNFFIEGTYYYVKSGDIEMEDDSGNTGKLDNQEQNIIAVGIRVNF